MFKQITDLDGNEYFLIGSLLIFVVFFILIGIYILQLKKDYIAEISQLPLEDPNEYEKV